MQIRLERAKSIGRRIGLNDEKGFAIAIFIVLVLITAFFIGYYVFIRPSSTPYSAISLLDSQNSSNYPEVLVVNQNNTFGVWVSVDNHLGQSVQFQVQTKITSDLTTLPVNSQPINVTALSLKDRQSWKGLETVTENQVGSYSVVFELWQYNSATGSYEFTNNFCVLNIQVIS